MPRARPGEGQLAPERPLEQVGLALRVVQLDGRVARRGHAHTHPALARPAAHARDNLRMRPVEAVGDAQDAAQPPYEASLPPVQPSEVAVAPFRKRTPVVARHVGDQLDLARREAVQITMHDQVVGVLVVLLVIDQIPHVVQQRRRLQNVPPGWREGEGVAQRVEQPAANLRHVLAVPLVGATLAGKPARRF